MRDPDTSAKPCHERPYTARTSRCDAAADGTPPGAFGRGTAGGDGHRGRAPRAVDQGSDGTHARAGGWVDRDRSRVDVRPTRGAQSRVADVPRSADAGAPVGCETKEDTSATG